MQLLQCICVLQEAKARIGASGNAEFALVSVVPAGDQLRSGLIWCCLSYPVESLASSVPDGNGITAKLL